jgi:hypothetical protein
MERRLDRKLVALVAAYATILDAATGPAGHLAAAGDGRRSGGPSSGTADTRGLSGRAAAGSRVVPRRPMARLQRISEGSVSACLGMEPHV